MQRSITTGTKQGENSPICAVSYLKPFGGWRSPRSLCPSAAVAPLEWSPSPTSSASPSSSSLPQFLSQTGSQSQIPFPQNNADEMSEPNYWTRRMHQQNSEKFKNKTWAWRDPLRRGASHHRHPKNTHKGTLFNRTDQSQSLVAAVSLTYTLRVAEAATQHS